MIFMSSATIALYLLTDAMYKLLFRGTFSALLKNGIGGNEIWIADWEKINEKMFARQEISSALTERAWLIENVIISLGCACRPCWREPQKGQSYGQKVSWLNGHADIIFFTYTQIADLHA